MNSKLLKYDIGTWHLKIKTLTKRSRKKKEFSILIIGGNKIK